MTPNATLLELAKSMKELGARRFEVPGMLSVEFGEAPASGKPIASTLAPAEPENCHCGHSIHMHNGGLCVAGCEPTTCLGNEAPQ